MFDYHFYLVLAFVLGYVLLTLEKIVYVNKAATALLTGILCWGIYLNGSSEALDIKSLKMTEHLASISQILFFLIGAMTIVELMASYQSFQLVERIITLSSSRKLYWMILWIGFWMSAVLDNLTTIIVLVTLLRHIVPDLKLQQLYCAGLVFTVNVGGAWTPIGDITTTFLWIEGKINTFPLMMGIFLPSIVSFLIFGFLYSFLIPKETISRNDIDNETVEYPGKKLILWVGILGLIAVPILKVVWNIPPFMGIMTSLAVLWVVTDIIRRQETGSQRKEMSLDKILRKIDIPTVLFFLGILLAVGSLQASGILQWLAAKSDQVFSGPFTFSLAVGFISSIIDNVPLVAAIIKMYGPEVYPTDNLFWYLIAYTGGVGGSMLIIGSAPGVALMSLKNISFFWYLKKVTLIAIASFLCGWAMFYIQSIFI